MADLDGDGRRAVAEEIGARGVAVDVADPAQVDALVASNHRPRRPIDLFCANAGIARRRSRLADDDWDLLGRQRHAPTSPPPAPPAGLAGARLGLLAHDRVGRRTADQSAPRRTR